MVKGTFENSSQMFIKDDHFIKALLTPCRYLGVKEENYRIKEKKKGVLTSLKMTSFGVSYLCYASFKFLLLL